MSCLPLLPEETFRLTTLPLPGGLPLTVAHLPGIPPPDDAVLALLRAARRVPRDRRVCILGPGLAAPALWAARQGATVLCWTEHLAEAHALRATFRRHGIPLRFRAEGGDAPHICYLQEDFQGLPSGTCDVALLRLPRGRQLQKEHLALAAALLSAGGKLLFVGAKREGVRTALKEARQLFGRAGVVVRKGGYHIAMALRPEGDFPLPTLSFAGREIVVDGVPTRLVSCEGVFAADRLDDGAAALIAGMRLSPDAEALDLGCGTGLVGLAALRRGANVTLVDVSLRAVASARRTLAANGFADAPLLPSWGATALPARHFDFILANPPFHRGHGVDFETSRLFITEARRHLRAGGRLYLVANAFLRYGPWLRAAFPRVTVAWENGRFRVWEARA